MESLPGLISYFDFDHREPTARSCILRPSKPSSMAKQKTAIAYQAPWGNRSNDLPRFFPRASRLQGARKGWPFADKLMGIFYFHPQTFKYDA
jgi:hypothetical protein